MRSFFHRHLTSRPAKLHAAARRRSIKPRPARRLQLESLEGRQMLSWTVMMYMAADDKGPGNDLTLSRVNEVALDIARMPVDGSSGAMHIVAQIDSVGYGAADATKLFGGAAGARRGLIVDNGLPGGDWGTDLGNLDSADPQSLINFVQWTMANYPADHYALIVWGESAGFSGVVRDDTSGTVMKITGLTAALDAIPHLDMVGFDGGLMGSVEIAAQLRGAADYMVASEADIPAPTPANYATGYVGWDYNFLDTLRNNASMLAEDLGAEIVGKFGTYYAGLGIQNVTLSAIDISALGDSGTGLVGALAGFSDVMLNVASQGDWNKLDAARTAAQGFGSGNYDLGDMMNRFSLAAGVAGTVATAAAAVQSKVTDAVVAKYAGTLISTATTGLSVYKPDLSTTARSFDYDFNLSLLVDTNWTWVATDFGPRRGVGVTIIADPLVPGSRAMVITGTPNDDSILVRIINGRIRVNGSFWSQGRNYGASVRHIYVFAGEGNDTVAISNSVSRSVVVLAGAGNDSVTCSNNLGLLIGGAGNDMLAGGNGENTLVGGDGNDALYGGVGADLFFGGDGNDYVQGGSGNDWVVGGRGDDQMWGELGRDFVLGGAGNDAITGGDGNDFITGGAGNDEIYGDGGADRIYAGDGTNIAYGGDGNDHLYGGRQADVLYGDVGADIVAGGGGADELHGGDGRNLLIGGTEADQVFAESGADIVVGGITVHDGDDAALSAILLEWARAKYNRTARIAHITHTSGVGANGAYFLRPGVDVFDDVVANDLFYTGNSNWFPAYANDRLSRTA